MRAFDLPLQLRPPPSSRGKGGLDKLLALRDQQLFKNPESGPKLGDESYLTTSTHLCQTTSDSPSYVYRSGSPDTIPELVEASELRQTEEWVVLNENPIDFDELRVPRSLPIIPQQTSAMTAQELAPRDSQQPNPTQASTYFPKFSSLPLEIRLMIWRAALPGPRIVELRVRKLKKTYRQWLDEQARTVGLPTSSLLDWGELIDFQGEIGNVEDVTESMDSMQNKNGGIGEGDFPLYGLRAMCQNPQVLFVNREAYEVAAKVFRCTFNTHYSVAETYFDFERDTIFLRQEGFNESPADEGYDGFMALSECEDVNEVQNLAILLNCSYYSRGDSRVGQLERDVSYLVAFFPNVKKVILAIQHHDATIPKPLSWLEQWEKYVDRSPISFIEPINVNTVFNDYWCSTLDFLPPWPMELANTAHLASSRIWLRDLFRLPRLRQKMLRLRHGENNDQYVLPAIEWKISITEEVRTSTASLMRGQSKPWRAEKTVKPGDYTSRFIEGEKANANAKKPPFECMSWEKFLMGCEKRFRDLEEEKRRKEAEGQ